MDGIVRAHWAALSVIGFLGGILSSGLGIGSGVLVVPALVMGLEFSQKAAQGTSLALMVPMALMGAVRYYRNPATTMDLGVILVMVPFAVAGANLGSSLAAWIPGDVLRRVFGLFAVVAGIRMLWPR
jgi:uncharacterized membrane protein YfcA